MSCVADADYYILQNIRLVFDRWQLLCVCVCCEFKKVWALSQHKELDGGAPPGPKTDRDHLYNER